MTERAAPGPEVASVDEVLSDGRVRADGKGVDQVLIDALRARLPDLGRGRGEWPAGTSFGGATFFGDVDFSSAVFAGRSGPDFARATFEGDVRFSRAVFQGPAQFLGARFEGDAWFDDARFDDAAYFSRTTFLASPFLDAATFVGTVAFEAARFADARALGPILALKEVILWDAVFEEPVEIAIAGPAVDANRLQLRKGGTLRIRWADVDIAVASFAEATLLTGADALPLSRWKSGDLDESKLVEQLGAGAASDPRPRLLSLQHANANNLVLGTVDLRRCTFADARNLDLIRLLPEAELPATPGWRARKQAPSLPTWMWTRRQIITDEYVWRLRRGKDRDPVRLVELLAGARIPWSAGDGGYAGLEAARLRRDPDAAEIAGLYRQLRASREDAKDSPGAGDFYYGEAEMRRLAPTTPAAERIILWLYWLVSGYGLRALRALAALAITIGVFALLLWRVGFDPDTSLVRALLFSAASTSSLFRAPALPSGTTLTELGELLQLFLRLLGPLFFGLALLSLRGRVKR